MVLAYVGNETDKMSQVTSTKYFLYMPLITATSMSFVLFNLQAKALCKSIGIRHTRKMRLQMMVTGPP